MVLDLPEIRDLTLEGCGIILLPKRLHQPFVLDPEAIGLDFQHVELHRPPDRTRDHKQHQQDTQPPDAHGRELKGGKAVHAPAIGQADPQLAFV